MNQPYRVELLGGLRVHQDDRIITRFRTQKTAALLAYLALYLERSHGREELIERLWPESRLEAGQTNLRVAVSSLRRQLEPPGTPQGSILVVERVSLRLNAFAVTTDVAEFEVGLQSASRAAGVQEQAQRLIQTVGLYRGELLSGFYDEWVLSERERLSMAFLGALRRLVKTLEQSGEIEAAINYAHRTVKLDPLQEEAYADLIRLYAGAGRPDSALHHYRALEHVLQEEFGAQPSAATRALVETMRYGGSSDPPAGEQADTSPSGSRISTTLLPPGSLTPPSPIRRAEPTSLPMQFTRFFGREEEMARLTALLSRESRVVSRESNLTTDHRPPTTEDAASNAPTYSRLTTHDSRLVTLTGSGGSGKTRLAIEVARAVAVAAASPSDPSETLTVWFVPLADIADPSLIAGTIADFLRLPRSPGVEPLEQVVEALAGKPSLLILDNLEQLLTEEAGFVTAGVVRILLERVPRLTCLATSRQHLGLEAEYAFPVEPLPVPTNPDTPERLMEFAGIQLFVDRAQKARPDFQVTPRNAASIAALCERLEGIPLALELAAAWSLTLTPAQMLSRLERRFDLLVNRRKDVSPRHRTLRTAIEWSYRLLSPDLQWFFACLSVFRGGWTLEAAEYVSGQWSVVSGQQEGGEEEKRRRGPSAAGPSRPGEEGSGSKDSRLSTLNSQLCPSNSRLEALASLRERSLIVAEKSGDEMRYRFLETIREFAGEQLTEAERGTLERRHAEFYLRMTEEAKPHFDTADQQAWLNRMDAEWDNIRAAIAWSLREEPTAETALRFIAFLHHFWIMRVPIAESAAWAEQALAREGASPLIRARAHAIWGGLMHWVGDQERSCEIHRESLRLLEEIGDEEWITDVQGMLAASLHSRGLSAEAVSIYENVLERCRATGDHARIASGAACLGSILITMGQYERAQVLLAEGLEIERRAGNNWRIQRALGELSHLAILQGDPHQAMLYLKESLVMAQELDDKLSITNIHHQMGFCARDMADYPTARRMFEHTLVLAREAHFHDADHFANATFNLGEIARRQGDLDEAVVYFKESLILYRTTVQHDRGFPWLLEAFAMVACAQCRHERAARLFGAAEAGRDHLDYPLPPNAEAENGPYVARARAALGEAAFAAAWEEGRALWLEQAIEETMRG